MEVIRGTEWSTDYAGTEFRILVVDQCDGCGLTESHFLQVKGESTAKCMNGGTVITDLYDGTEDDNHNADADRIERQIMSGETDAESHARRILRGMAGAKTDTVPPAVFSHADSPTRAVYPYRGAEQYRTMDAADFDRNRQ